MKRRERSWQNPWKVAFSGNYSGVWVGLVVCCIAGVLFSIFLYAVMVEDQNNEREAQFVVMHQLQEVNGGGYAKDNVKVVAASVVLAKDHGSESLGTDDARFVDALRNAARTGNVPEPTMPKGTWGTYLSVWFPIEVAVIYVLVWLSFGYCYVRETFKRREYLADLRWSTFDTLVFALVMATPLLPALAVSVVRMAYYAERDQAEARACAKEAAAKGDQEAPAVVFEDDRAGALKAYRMARNAATAENLERKKIELAEEIKSLTGEGLELSALMRGVQERRVIARASLQQVEGFAVGSVEIDEEQIEIEFNRLVTFAGVTRARPYGDGIQLFVVAQLTYEGVCYDLGDWDLRISRIGVQAYELRTGVKKGWSWLSYPPYRHSEDRFCFGNRQRKLDDHALRGQILEAASLAIECLCSVNEEHQTKIPDAFNRIEDE